MNDLPRLEPDDTFQFSCHPGISCFNCCCRDLNQFLTPYDMLRLKGALGLSSKAFLRRYTVCHTGPETGLPVVSLRMEPHKSLACPFVTAEGCAVYENRPGACRTYPLGRIAARKPGRDLNEEIYFLIREPHCRGFRETKEQTVRTWIEDQELVLYNEMNDLMIDIISLKTRSMPGVLSPGARALFYTAFYDLDGFKESVLDGRLKVEPSIWTRFQDAVNTNNEPKILRLALEWVKKAVFEYQELPVS